ncbi:MAG: type II toxin-antitoxin system RelE/ParE family toxin [Aestuariivirga sp.]
MLISVVETIPYLRDAERLLTEDERALLINSLAANPLQGVLIKGTGGLRKLRVGMSGRGKRGGGRVVYWFHSDGYPIVLLAVFAKNEASDLTAREQVLLGKMAEQLKSDFERRK